MFKLNSKLTMACSAAVLALAMAACSSSSDDNPPVASSTPPPVGDGGPDPVLTELEMAQAADAAAAATAAMTASPPEADATAAHGSHAAAQVTQKEASAIPCRPTPQRAGSCTRQRWLTHRHTLPLANAIGDDCLHGLAKAAYTTAAAEADHCRRRSVANATALQTSAKPWRSAMAAQTQLTGASDAQKAAFGEYRRWLTLRSRRLSELP